MIYLRLIRGLSLDNIIKSFNLNINRRTLTIYLRKNNIAIRSINDNHKKHVMLAIKNILFGEQDQNYVGECTPDKSWYARWFNYGITKPQFEKMLEEQSGLCGLCFEALPDNLSFVYIDHCHTQGHVRALLHKDCNTGLGFLENDKFVANAFRYIEKHRR